MSCSGEGEGSRDLSWRALGQLLSYPPELLVTALGQDRYRGGVVSLCECLQCHTLNKQVCPSPSFSPSLPLPSLWQLLYSLLDVILLELFPELNNTEQHSM